MSPWREAVVAASSSSAPDVIFARDARVTLRPYPAVSDLYVCVRAGARATALGGLMVSSQDHQVSGQGGLMVARQDHQVSSQDHDAAQSAAAEVQSSSSSLSAGAQVPGGLAYTLGPGVPPAPGRTTPAPPSDNSGSSFVLQRLRVDALYRDVPCIPYLRMYTHTHYRSSVH